MEETIAAISTAAGPAGIAIVRVSGPNALAVADAVFHSPRGAPSSYHTIHFGTIGRNGDLIDQVMLSVMHAPRTYTGENTCEINCHGGTLTARKILAACLHNGARLAEPGEFTKRAFLNGKLDLTQAEAVMDLISAKSDRAHAAAAHAIKGHLAIRINQLRNTLIEVLAHLEAQIDFPEDDIAPATLADLKMKLVTVADSIRNLVQTAREGRILRGGLRVTIVGRPNSGKSSLLNALLGQDRAIVTAVPGTTRDTLEEYASIDGIPFVLTDTAGIRTARGHVERIGVERSCEAVLRSDLVLHVVDASRPVSRADLDIVGMYYKKPSILVLNKSDLRRRFETPPQLSHLESHATSCLTGIGLNEVRSSISKLALGRDAGETQADVVINDRHESELRLAYKSLTEVLSGIDSSTALDITCQQLRSVIQRVNYVCGRQVTEDVLDKIFSTFCIGK